MTKETTLVSERGEEVIKLFREDKSTNRPYPSRYIGSLVTDFHRNLLKGGIYSTKHRQPPGRQTAFAL
ncbi:hypothetical protein ACNKHU_26570 [Shigella flexneri]